MPKIKNVLLKKYAQVQLIISKERGSLKDMTWVVGSAVVVALVIVAAMVFVPDTAKTFWQSATQWIRGEFGF